MNWTFASSHSLSSPLCIVCVKKRRSNESESLKLAKCLRLLLSVLVVLQLWEIHAWNLSTKKIEITSHWRKLILHYNASETDIHPSIHSSHFSTLLYLLYLYTIMALVFISLTHILKWSAIISSFFHNCHVLAGCCV